ncbi:amidase [Neorhizobium sp. P12A]|uniref:amidase n=1 Tax=Neorhizobium sp. P12A TaxID=2268027 RepID=UPI0011EEDBAF|nr:amidase [Neorhizobium sp. P12A]KAA0693647.1 amidase [Neorhizobium sp. P12A]
MPIDKPNSSDNPAVLSAIEAAQALRSGMLTSVDLVTACLDRIDRRDGDVRAWSHYDRDAAILQAKAADARRATGEKLGLFHGLPVGVKDVFDTADMPSEYGSEIYRGRRPAADAAAVTRLREAGAIIIGKTATSEFGMYHPSPTRNPLDLTRSPGVSSAGSAAAVVDYMVPLALGTQHTASTTLPASFCGAYAFKPSLGFSDMRGSNILVPRLAHLGFLARSVEDLGFFASAFDPDLGDTGWSDALPAPRMAFVCGPAWPLASQDAAAALETLLAKVAGKVGALKEASLPREFDDALIVVMGLLDAHLAFRFGGLREEDFSRLCPPLRAGVENGRTTSAPRYLELDAQADRLTELASDLFADRDLLVTLSTPGEATRLEDGPGSGAMSMPWSLCGLPTVSLPLLTGAHGLPIGVQLIGQHGRDHYLLKAASWFVSRAGL